MIEKIIIEHQQAGGLIQLKTENGMNVCTIFNNSLTSEKNKPFFYSEAKAKQIAEIIKEALEGKI